MSQYGTASPSPLRTRQWSAGQDVAETAAGQGQEVASAAADRGRQVASTAAGQGQEVVSAAADRGQEVARLATQDVRELAGAVREEAAEVTDELWAQSRQLVRETTEQVRTQAEAQTERLAETLRRLSNEGYALAQGRPNEATTVSSYIVQAAERLEQLAEEIQSRGVDGLAEEVQYLARRRPAAFILGAALVGFGAGRLIRSGAASDGDSNGEVAGSGNAVRARSLPAGAR